MAGKSARLLAQLKALESVPWICPVTAAEEIAEHAREEVPVDTGYLQSTIQAQHLTNSSQVVVRAKYAGYVEFGTYKMPAHPYLRPAVDNYQRQIMNAVAEAMMGEINVVIRTARPVKPRKK